jgi:hypothetical protein
VDKENSMPTLREMPTLALAMGALVVYLALGAGGVLVVATGSLLVMSYLAHRYVDTHLDGQYPRHGDRMD